MPRETSASLPGAVTTASVPDGFSLSESKRGGSIGPAAHRRRWIRRREVNELEFNWENMMSTKRKIEIFSAGWATCKETIELVKRIAGSSHEVVIH